MFKPNRLIAAGAVIGALAAAGPVASASAAQPAAVAASGTTAGSSIPCYPFPAFCDPSTGQPASWAPWWVWPALGLQPPQGYPSIPLQPITVTPVTGQPFVVAPITGVPAN